MQRAIEDLSELQKIDLEVFGIDTQLRELPDKLSDLKTHLDRIYGIIDRERKQLADDDKYLGELQLEVQLQNELLNMVSMFLSLGVGSQMVASKFLQPTSLSIVLLGLVAFSIATAAGVVFAKIMNLFLKEKVNPLIGSAGVSAVPMSARVSNKIGLQADPANFLIMHAMGPNVSGVIGTAIAAGVMIAVYAVK